MQLTLIKIIIFKISVKNFPLIKSENLYRVFPSWICFSETSCKCLCTHFGHMTKFKTPLNILLRTIEHNNWLLDHLFFYRLCTIVCVIAVLLLLLSLLLLFIYYYYHLVTYLLIYSYLLYDLLIIAYLQNL